MHMMNKLDNGMNYMYVYCTLMLSVIKTSEILQQDSMTHEIDKCDPYNDFHWLCSYSKINIVQL